MAGDRESEYPFHGVKHHRRLTDIPCCVIFVGWVFFAFVTIGQSFAQGNLDACICGSKSKFDPATATCKLDANGINIPKISSFANPINETTDSPASTDARPICLRSCSLKGVVCADGSDFESVKEARAKHRDQTYTMCGFHNAATQSGQYCKEPGSSDIHKAASAAVGLRKALPVFAVGVVIAALTGFGYIKVIQKKALTMINVFRGVGFVVVVAQVGAAGFVFVQSSRSGESGDKVFAYTSILAALLFTVILRALRHRARKVAEVFRIATYCIFDLPSLPLVAVGIAPVLFAVVIFWAGTLPFSVSSAITGGSGGANITAWSAVEADKTYDSIKSFNRIFVSSTAVIWTAEFLHSFVVAVVALAVGGWYFKPQTGAPESDGHPRSVAAAWMMVTKYHLGTVAFAGALSLIVKIMKALARMASAKGQDGGGVMAVVSACGACFTRAVTAVVKYLSRNALIFAMLNGANFLSSGMYGVRLIVSHLVTILSVQAALHFFTFVGVFAVTSVTLLVGYAILGLSSSFDDVNLTLVYIILALIAIVVGRLFTTTFELVVDTIFLCIIEDRDVTKRRGGDAAGAFGTDQVHDAMNDVCGRVNPEPPASDAGGAVGYKPPALQAAPTKHGTVHNPEYGGQAVYFAMTPGQANQSPGVRHQQQLTSQPQPHQGFGHPQQPGTVVSHAPIQQAHGVPPSVYPSTAARLHTQYQSPL